MIHQIWLRVTLPENALESVRQDAPACDFRQGDDTSIDPE